MRMSLLILGLMSLILSFTIPLAMVKINEEKQQKPSAYVVNAQDDIDLMFKEAIKAVKARGCYAGDLETYCLGPMTPEKMSKCGEAVAISTRELDRDCKGLQEKEN